MLAPGAPPPLEPGEAARSAVIAARIRARIAERGWIPFSEFMRAALYEPELGYYMAERPIFGGAGDFVTAPELSPLYAACLAQAVAGLLAKTGGGELVEFGAGSGRMAGELFGELARRGAPPARYRIVETSPALARRQRERLAHSEQCAPFIERFEWLDSPPQHAWRGVAIASEVVDALPVDRFRVAREGCEAIGVAVYGDGFRWEPRPADAATAAAVSVIQRGLPAPMPAGYVSELRPGLSAWIGNAAAGLERGALFVIDYGLPRAQYYHPSRDGGTLCGFRRHHRVDDPLATPGAQDLTAWVDFSALADAARAAGLELGGFTTQAHFLLDTGIERELARLVEAGGERERAAHRRNAATLLLPGEMGERFKVLALTRGLDGPIEGFGFRDFRANL